MRSDKRSGGEEDRPKTALYSEEVFKKDSSASSTEKPVIDAYADDSGVRSTSNDAENKVFISWGKNPIGGNIVRVSFSQITTSSSSSSSEEGVFDMREQGEARTSM